MQLAGKTVEHIFHEAKYGEKLKRHGHLTSPQVNTGSRLRLKWPTFCPSKVLSSYMYS